MNVAITAMSYLGDRTTVALEELGVALAARGVEVHVVDLERTSDAARRDAVEIDLVWICGALYTDLRRERRLDHDVVAVPVFAGQTAPLYHSVIVARPDGPASMHEALAGTVALNERSSWSGHRALRRHVAPRWFVGELETGSHVASLRAVTAGDADCAAVDHTIWEALDHDDIARTALRVLDRTVDWPAPPLVIRRGVAPAVRDVVASGIRAAGPLSGVRSFVPGDAARYEVMS